MPIAYHPQDFWTIVFSFTTSSLGERRGAGEAHRDDRVDGHGRREVDDEPRGHIALRDAVVAVHIPAVPQIMYVCACDMCMYVYVYVYVYVYAYM